MARVTIKDITEGGSLNIEDVNDTIESWNDASKQINGDNVRIQGLDQRVFGPVVRKPPTAYTSGSGAGWVPHSPTLNFLPVKTTGADAIIVPSWFSSEGDTLIIRASFQFYMLANGERYKDGTVPVISFVLQYGDGQNYYELNNTQRTFQISYMYSDESYGWPVQVGTTTYLHEYGFNWESNPKGDTPTEQTCTIVHLVEPGELSRPGHKFRIAYRAANADLQITSVPSNTYLDTPKVYIGWLNFNSTVYRR